MEMADLGAVGTGPGWEVPETAYAYHLRIKLKEVSHIEEVIRSDSRTPLRGDVDRLGG